MKNLLGIQQLKGQSDRLKGRLIAFARITTPTDQTQSPSGLPMDQMVHNGIMAVIGDYLEEKSLKEFVRNLANSSSSESKEEKADIGEIIDHLKEAEGLDPEMDEEEVLKHLDSMTHVEIIPVPARVGHFESEQEILEEDADVFFLGEFANPHNAQLSTTTFPILYQSAYKEQENQRLNKEIDLLLENASQKEAVIKEVPKSIQPELSKNTLNILQTQNYQNFQGNLSEFLLEQFVPVFLNHSQQGHDADFELFERFMDDYPFQEDLTRFEKILSELNIDSIPQHQELKLLCKKFSALRNEEFEQLSQIQAQLEALQD